MCIRDSLLAVSFTDASHGWAVGASGTILATTNGGSIWAAQTSGTTDALRAVTFTDAGHGWAVGDSGTILVASDGRTWSARSSGTVSYTHLRAHETVLDLVC